MSTHHDDDPLTIEAICLLARPQLQHDEAMIGLATALGNADPHELRDGLDDNARPLFDLANAPLVALTSACTATHPACRKPR